MNDDLNSLLERYRRDHDSRVFAPLADAYRKNGEIDKAIEILEKGIEKHPRYGSAHVILAKCYYDKGATERAKAEFRRVLELDGDNMVALKFLGDILLAEDARAEAAQYYRSVLAVDPTNEEVARTLKDLETSFVVKEIDLGKTQAVRDERPRELATMTLAGIYAAQGYYNKALKIYNEVLDREPGNREAKEMVAKLESIMNSADAERDKAFQEDVLTISLNDISDDVSSSTAGHGGAGATPQGGAPPEGIRDKEPGARPVTHREDVSGGATGSRPPESQPPAAKPPDAPAGETAGGDMEQFQRWLRKLKGK